MQGCFGDSLVRDWRDAGADFVLSYDGLNRNFFYPEFFLKNLKALKGDVRAAYSRTNQTIERELQQDEFYRRVVQGMGQTMDEYLDNAPNPSLSTR